MCGDSGFSDELFQCKNCQFRSKHCHRRHCWFRRRPERGLSLTRQHGKYIQASTEALTSCAWKDLFFNVNLNSTSSPCLIVLPLRVDKPAISLQPMNRHSPSVVLYVLWSNIGDDEDDRAHTDLILNRALKNLIAMWCRP